jgi:serine/threonine-protein kinase
MAPSASPTVVGRYVLHAPIARGGMATIHLARLLGAEGFSRMVAAKRLHPQFVEDEEFVEMFLDEARIASKIHHPNVVPVLDVVQSGTEVILVQEYIHGIALDKLLRASGHTRRPLPVEVVVAIVSDMLAGLSAAHEARDELSEPLGIVHRDVSPQNVLVGVDGVARLLDFGVAKAANNAHVTRVGVFKGKIAYSAPEQLRGTTTRASDLYAAAVVLWEALAGRRLHPGMSEAELVAAVSSGVAPGLLDGVDRAALPPERWALLQALAPVVARAMAFAPEERHATAAELLDAVRAAAPGATATEVSRWVKLLGKEYLEGRERLIVAEESTWRQRASAVPAAAEPTSAPASDAAGSLRASVLPAVQARAQAHRAVVTALAVIGALLACVVMLLARRAPEPVTVAAPALPAAPPLVAPEVPTVVPAATATPPASASADAGPAPTASPRPPARAVPYVPRANASPQAATSTDCSPPFYFDGKKKIFKPGCL